VISERPPNDRRISCRLSSPRPHKPSFLRALTETAARTELRAPSACRLHARVRQPGPGAWPRPASVPWFGGRNHARNLARWSGLGTKHC
jgi:hypothetical protein